MEPDNSKKGFDFDPIDLSGILPQPKNGAGDDAKQVLAEAPLPETVDEDTRTLEALYLKMKKKGDFPTFSRQIIDVNRIIATDKSSAKDISHVIMKDFSLTNKLLKLVNSAMYSQFNQNGISSVASAMIIMGTNQIQRTASSLMLFEHMQNNAQNQALRDATLLTYMSGLMAKDLAALEGYRDPEEFQICGMFHKLGENLVAFYFPDKLRLIQEIERTRGMSREEAARKILGIDFRTLGTGIAKKWGLPHNIVKSMDFDPEELAGEHRPGEPLTRTQRLGSISSFCNCLCDIHRNPFQEERDAAICHLLKNFKGLVDLSLSDLDSLVKRVADRMRTHASLMNIATAQNPILANMDQPVSKTRALLYEEKADKKEKRAEGKIMADAEKEITRLEDLLTRPFEISDILFDILKTMNRCFDYTRIAICIRDAGSGMVAVRHGLGKDIDNLKKQFRFQTGRNDDIFQLCLTREKDYTIHDIDDPKFKALIPGWFRQLDLARGLDLFALTIDHVPLGFFYADRETAIDHTPFGQQKNMKKLRSLAEKAIRIKKGMA